MTFVLIAIFAAAYAWEASWNDPAAAVMIAALVPYDLTHDVTLGVPVWLTPVTALVLHGGLWHVISNSLVLLAVGPAIEARCGKWRYLLFFVLCGIAGGLAQSALDPGSHRPIIGASGAISGILAAYLLRYPLARSLLGVPVAVPIILWTVLQCVQSGVFFTSIGSEQQAASNAVAYAAHVGGFMFGALTIGLFEKDAPPIRGSVLSSAILDLLKKKR